MKKIISIVMAMVIGCACVGCSGTKAAEDMNPGIVENENIEIIDDFDELCVNNEIEREYDVEITQVDEYWAVVISGAWDSTEGWTQDNVGFYDHYPTTEEVSNLLVKRLHEDGMSDYC